MSLDNSMFVVKASQEWDFEWKTLQALSCCFFFVWAIVRWYWRTGKSLKQNNSSPSCWTRRILCCLFHSNAININRMNVRASQYGKSKLSVMDYIFKWWFKLSICCYYTRSSSSPLSLLSSSSSSLLLYWLFPIEFQHVDALHPVRGDGQLPSQLHDPLKPISNLQTLCSLVVGAAIVHVDQLVLVVVVLGTLLTIAARLCLAAVLLLHAFVLCSAILEPHFNLNGEETI